MPSQPASQRTRRRASKTTPAIEGETAPLLPHERDESSDSQRSGPRDVIRQARDDVDRGLVDTGLGPPLEETYRRTQEAADAAAGKPGGEPDPSGQPAAASPAAPDHAAATPRAPPKR